MLKKRIIFTLLYDSSIDKFMLSRNFRLQAVGDLGWLLSNYNFRQLSISIDELILLDVSRGNSQPEKFLEILDYLSKCCFVPISTGGNLHSYEYTMNLFRAGTDKVIVNSLLHQNPEIVAKLASSIGQQSLIASIDYMQSDPSSLSIYYNNASKRCSGNDVSILFDLINLYTGEAFLTSIERDGTGHGLETSVLDTLFDKIKIPIILSGGAGKPQHLLEALSDPRVQAVSTAHLFNFMGSTLQQTRNLISSSDIDLPNWE